MACLQLSLRCIPWLLQREKSKEYGGMESTWLLQDLEEPGADGIQALENFRRELSAGWGCFSYVQYIQALENFRGVSYH